MLLFAGFAAAQPGGVQPQTVVVFPSGPAFVVAKGELNFQDRRAKLTELPPAVNERVWFEPAADFRILQAIRGLDTLYEKKKATNFFDVLRANVGSRAVITYRIGDEIEEVKGKVLPFETGEDLIRIEALNGSTVFIPKEQLQQVGIEGEANTYYLEPKMGEVTRVDIDQWRATAPVYAYYYQDGLNWQPNYTLLLLNDSVAILELRAQIQNGPRVIPNVNMLLGMPEVATFTPDAQGQRLFARLVRQADDTANLGPRLVDVGRLSFQPEAVAEREMTKRAVAYRETYRIAGALHVDSTTGYPLQVQELPLTPTRTLYLDSLPMELLPNAPLLVRSTDGQTYFTRQTPSRSSPALQVDLGPALELEVLATERLTKREEKAEKIDGVNYDFYEVRGSIRLVNPTLRFLPVEITQPALGRVYASNRGSKEKTGREFFGNDVYRLTWQVLVPPEYTLPITYRYSYYLPQP